MWPLKNRQNKGINGENGSLMKVESIAECSSSALLLTCIKQYLVLKTHFGVIFEWPLKTGFTVIPSLDR